MMPQPHHQWSQILHLHCVPESIVNVTASDLDQLARAWESGTAKVSDYFDGKMSQMKSTAKRFMNQTFQLPEGAQDLKAKIGIAIEQPLHSVRQALAGIPDFRGPTVADGIRTAGKGANTLGVTNYLAIALDYSAADLTIENVCNDAVDIQEEFARQFKWALSSRQVFEERCGRKS
jgi:hypothetical protein